MTCNRWVLDRGLRRGRQFASCSTLLLLLSATQASDDEIERVIRQVRCTEIAFSLAAEARDKQKFASFLDADTRFVGNSVSRGAEAVVDAWSAFFDENGPQLAWRPQFVEVLESGDLALSRGPYRLNAVNDTGENIEQWGTYNSVWRKSADGKWRIIFDAGNAASAPPPNEIRQLLEQPHEDCQFGE